MAVRISTGITRAQQDSGEKRVQQVLQTLEPDSQLRSALQQGLRGDGVHYWWMDIMRTFGIKQAAFQIDFEYRRSNTDLKIKGVKYLTTYYRYDTAITDNSTLHRVRVTGLSQGLESAILDRARGFVTQQTKRWPKDICGTLYMNLLDDEVLPILDEMPEWDRCSSKGKTNLSSATDANSSVQLPMSNNQRALRRNVGTYTATPFAGSHATGLPAQDEPATASYCDLVNDPTRFVGNLVRIQVSFYSWLDGTSLYDSNCGEFGLKPVFDCETSEKCRSMQKALEEKTDHNEELHCKQIHQAKGL